MDDEKGDDFNQARALLLIYDVHVRARLAQMDHSRVPPENEDAWCPRPSFQYFNSQGMSRNRLTPVHNYMNSLEWVPGFNAGQRGFFNAAAIETVRLDFLESQNKTLTVPVTLQGHNHLLGRERERSRIYERRFEGSPLPFVLRRHPKLYDLPVPSWAVEAESSLEENYQKASLDKVQDKFPWTNRHVSPDLLLKPLVLSPVLEHTRTKFLLEQLPKVGMLRQIQGKQQFYVNLGTVTREVILSMKAAVGQWATVTENGANTRGPLYVAGIANEDLLLVVGAKDTPFSRITLQAPQSCRLEVRPWDTIQKLQYSSVIDSLASMRRVFLPMTAPLETGRPLVNQTAANALENRDDDIFINKRLTKEQKQGVAEILLHKYPSSIYTVSGSAGCGKTAVLQEVVLQLIKHNTEKEPWDALIAYAVPTNSAAEAVVNNLVKVGVPEDRILHVVSENQLDRMGKQDSKLVQLSSVAKLQPRHHVLVGTVIAISKMNLNKAAERSRPALLMILDESAAVAFADAAALFVHSGQPIHIVLAGDVNQLPPKTMSRLNALLYGTTSIVDITRLSPVMYENYLQEINKRNAEYYSYPRLNPGFGVLLNKNFRSHPHLVETTSDLFYDGLMVPGGNFDMSYHEHLMDSLRQHVDTFKPHFNGASLFWMDIEGQMERELKTDSPFNRPEAQAVVSLTNKIHNVLGSGRVTVLSPYKAQVTLLKELQPQFVPVHTVDEIQGMEREVVVVSLVRCHDGLKATRRNTNLGFLSSRERCNVMLSRGKNVVIFVGSRSLFTGDNFTFWPQLYNRCLPLG